MTLYEIKYNEAQLNDKIVYYDYLLYKEAICWKSFINNDWHRPLQIKRAMYNGKFLNKLPNYYFLGFPIKELIKSNYSSGLCHSCAVALSLCFDNFEIITCNLSNYADHYKEKTKNNTNEFEHTFLIININNQKVVVDTTWGIITDFNTYNQIFGLKNIRVISSNELASNDIYQYIKNRKDIKWRLYNDEYEEEINKYMTMVRNYRNSNNKQLEDFIRRCLLTTSNNNVMYDLMQSHELKGIISYHIDYPNFNMMSLIDDEHDFLVDSANEETRKRNKQVLENYYNKEEEKSKIKVK